MKKINFFLCLLILLGINTLQVQGTSYPYFQDSPLNEYYPNSWIGVTAPSELECAGDDQNNFPVETGIQALQGNNCLRLKWRSVSGGNWVAIAAGDNWRVYDISQANTLSFYVYSPEGIEALYLPKIFLEDTNNNKTTALSLSVHISDILANQWIRISIPMEEFYNAPAIIDFTSVKTIGFTQNASDNIEHILYIDFMEVLSFPSGQVNSLTGISNGWFIVNGERFFVKGVCIFDKHFINGEMVDNTPEIWNYELNKIKDGNFNAISSYFEAEELDIVKTHGLMVLTSASEKTFIDISTIDKDAVYSRVREVMQYSKDYDNILSYTIDNEPQIIGTGDNSLDHGIYKAGEQEMIDYYDHMKTIIKDYKPEAITTTTTYPPAGFLDYSVLDAIFLNLYPFNPANNSIGYEGYGEWYKKHHAPNKPFIISEYGVDDRNMPQPEGLIIRTLDDQISAGATGSFFFMWRTFGYEKDEHKLGIVPNNCLPDDYLNTPRPIYDSLQKYFEAVIIEPKKEKVYGSVLPIQVYGTDSTNSVDAIFDGIAYPLTKTGIYWWESNISVSVSGMEEKNITIRAKDKNAQLLVEKKVSFYISSTIKHLKVKINEPIITGTTITARISVRNQDNQPVSNQNLLLGINQADVNMWVSESLQGVTDQNGEFQFTWYNAVPGYFTLMAGVETSTEYPESEADVVTLRVEKVTSIEQLPNTLADNNYFEITPNPANENAFLRYNISSKCSVNISISDISGKIIKFISVDVQQTGSQILEIDLQDLKSGIYLICIAFGNKTQFKKLIINK